MKKINLIVVLLCTTLGMISCSQNEEPYVPQEVELRLDYTFIENGSMSRTTGNDVYTTFYDKYIKTKQLTPTTYSLTFTNTKTGAIALVDGRWDSNDGIRLPEGTYKVSGISHRIINKGIDIHSEYVSDTTFISFNEDVSISPKQTTLNLTAQYDSYLLIFDSSNISIAEYKGLSRWNIKKHDNLFTIFVNRQSTYNSNDYIKITRTNGSSATIYLKDIPFEKGKYYYFNDMTNSFDIPQMESGN